MISINDKPRHLSVRTLRVRDDYPKVGFRLETLQMIAELDDRNIDFNITLLYGYAEATNAVITGEIPSDPDRKTVYIIGERNDMIAVLGEQMEVKRRSKKSDISISDWLAQRVIEYANSRDL